MINKETRMKESEQFKGESDCYIHIEMKNGVCERIIAGHGLAIIHGLCAAVDRLATLTGNSFDETLMAMQEWHHMAENTKED